MARPSASVLRRGRLWWGDHPWQQAFLVAGVIALFWLLGSTLLASMARLGLTPSLAFFSHPAGFDIGETLIDYSPTDSFGAAILVGLLNTIEVSILGCVLATILGTALGIGRLSSNPLLSGAVQVYIELIRNTPILLQLFFWSLILHGLPPPRQALHPFAGVFLCNRGVFFPALHFGGPQGIGLDLPALTGFNITGGFSVSPEFASLLTGLVVNAAAYIAECVRAGITSVPAGQWEAAEALGLSRARTLRLVVLPQALRVILPVLTSACLSLTKNSSLAVAIGFPDVVAVLNTIANQSGQGLQSIAAMIVVYLVISLTTSVIMNVYNRRTALKGMAR